VTAPAPPLPSFVAARLPLCGERVLVVAVGRAVLADRPSAHLYIEAFQRYFGRTIVLMAQDPLLVPTYYGPAAVVQSLARLPFEVIPWRRFDYRDELAQRWWLPIPPLPDELPSGSSWVPETEP